MNVHSDIQLMAERLESLKAGIIGGLSVGLAFLITSLVNNLVLAKYFPILASQQITFRNLHELLSCAIASSGRFAPSLASQACYLVSPTATSSV